MQGVLTESNSLPIDWQGGSFCKHLGNKAILSEIRFPTVIILYVRCAVRLCLRGIRLVDSNKLFSDISLRTLVQHDNNVAKL